MTGFSPDAPDILSSPDNHKALVIDTTRCVVLPNRGPVVLFGDRLAARLPSGTDIRRAGPEYDRAVVAAIAEKMPGCRLELAEAGLAAACERFQRNGDKS